MHSHSIPSHDSFAGRPAWSKGRGTVLSLIATLAILLGLIATPARASTAELIMFEQKGCVWCERWRAEIGPIYPKTQEGRAAPLRRVDIDEPIPSDLDGIVVERLTPVFVLLEDGREVARLRGYPGEDFFWGLLSQMVSKLEPPLSN